MSAGQVVFLPGTLCGPELFAPQMRRIAAAGWSSSVWNYDKFRDLDAWAADVLPQMPDKFALVGLSLGGIAAMALLRRAPERVNRLALLDTNPRGDTAENVAARERDFARAREIGLARFVAEELIPRQLHPARADNPSLRRIVLEMALGAGMKKWRDQLDFLATRRDSRPLLSLLRMPVLVGCGASDSVCPPELHRETAELIPGAMLRIFPQCGHLSSLEAADAVSDELIKLLNAPPDGGRRGGA